jgi:hypothetical protein
MDFRFSMPLFFNLWSFGFLDCVRVFRLFGRTHRLHLLDDLNWVQVDFEVIGKRKCVLPIALSST